MEATLEYHNRDYHPQLWAMLTAILVMAAAACAYCQHAEQKHGADAQAVRDCLEHNDPLQVWIKPDGRVVLVCMIKPNIFGVQIRDKSGKFEITSMIKNKMHRLSQIEAWLRNMNATQIFYPWW